MAYYYYGYDFPPPLVDHMHPRTHQHRNFFQYLTHQQPRPGDYPNQPDIDVRDAFTEYIVDIEVPGIKNPRDISVTWRTSRILVVSGNVVGPESGHSRTEKQENITGTIDTQGDGKDPQPHEPVLLVGERRLGPFRRYFTFPEEVDMEKLTAKLEAGVLQIRLPKKGSSAAKTGTAKVQ
jgi:HSP20 family molecular chaperone IbpA